ncbi:MAG: type I-E CRISPR-associated protein Cse1/CasA, partial [Acidobacteria bacterium]
TMTNLNLILDPWIPVRRRSGRRSYLAPWQVFGDAEDPAMAPASPRADLDGGIVQLLIGLLQAVMPPRDEEEWALRATGPPAPEELRRRLEPLAPAFELLGPGPRFLQDPRVARAGDKPWPAEKLLIDLGLSEGADHFARNGSVGDLCTACAAAALTTLQTSAPTGGRGHMTGMRGGGPLTTLVTAAGAGATLWPAVWLNVLPLSSWAHPPPPDLAASERVFPWLAATGPGEPKRAPELTPEDAHPLQCYFSMPRRLWLGDPEDGDCGLCGRRDLPVVTAFLARPNGIRYAGAWIHPLSPYRRTKDEQRLALKGDRAGLGYRHWLGLVVAPPGGAVEPALVVQEINRDGVRFEQAGDLRLWAFGYAMDNMRPIAWCEGRMPIYLVPAELAATYAAQVGRLVEGASLAERYLRFAVKKLIARRPKDVKNEPENVSTRFWERTEVAFYDLARQLLDALRASDDDEPLRRHWHRLLAHHARRIFEQEVSEADFRAADPGQVARAWKGLQNALRGKKILAALDLPIKKRPAAEKAAKGG